MLVKIEYQDFDFVKYNFVFYGKMYECVEVDEDVMKELDVVISYLFCVGYIFIDKFLEIFFFFFSIFFYKDVCEYKDVFNLIKNKIVCLV